MTGYTILNPGSANSEPNARAVDSYVATLDNVGNAVQTVTSGVPADAVSVVNTTADAVRVTLTIVAQFVASTTGNIQAVLPPNGGSWYHKFDTANAISGVTLQAVTMPGAVGVVPTTALTPLAAATLGGNVIATFVDV